jgi:hypothetical protein
MIMQGIAESLSPKFGLHNFSVWGVISSSVPFPLIQESDIFNSSANPFPCLEDFVSDPTHISLEDVVSAADGMKGDLQREANRSILRNDLNRAMTALAGMGHIDDFVYLLKIRAGSQLGQFIARKRGRPRKVQS